MNHKRMYQNKNNSKMANEFEDEKEEEKKESKSILLNEEEAEDESSESKDKNSKEKESINNDVESLTESIDEERITLGQINKIIDKQKKKNENEGLKSLLGQKKLLNYQPIIYNEKKGDIVNVFCSSPEELNEFLIHCKIQILSFDDFSSSFINNSNSISFNPEEWMQSNKIKQRTINLEDLSIFCNNKILNKHEKQENFIPSENIKEEKEIEIKSEKIMEKEENFQKNFQKFENSQVKYNYEELQKIISCEILSIKQKKWINNFLNEINNYDMKFLNSIDEKGRDNKLELVFDLDNTCIFSFLTNSNNKVVKALKERFSEKEAQLISFKYNNKVVYSILIIRKGLKEFINYIKPICNFHISTLGDDNYGKELSKLLEEYLSVNFMRFKGRSFYGDNSKNISDLYIKKERTVIIDDNIKVWVNKERDSENVIISKFFFDEKCAMITAIKENNQKDKELYEIDLFLKSYKYLHYNKMKKNTIDWKKQKFVEYTNIPFYQFNQSNDFNYNKCFTAEYLNTKKLQFIYLKNIIKEIYVLKFMYNIDPSLAIKLIRISTLNDMKFDLKYLTLDQREILADIIAICGGIIFEKEYLAKNEKIYLVVSKRLYKLKNKKEEIKKDLQNNPYYVLINERFILDTYYFMTNLKDNIKDPEYTLDEED